MYIRSKPPLVDEYAFPPTGFAVARLGCSLHPYAYTERSQIRTTYTDYMHMYMGIYTVWAFSRQTNMLCIDPY